MNRKVTQMILIAIVVASAVLPATAHEPQSDAGRGLLTLQRVLARLDEIIAASGTEAAIAAVANAFMQMVGAPDDDMHPFALYLAEIATAAIQQRPPTQSWIDGLHTLTPRGIAQHEHWRTFNS